MTNVASGKAGVGQEGPAVTAVVSAKHFWLCLRCSLQIQTQPFGAFHYRDWVGDLVTHPITSRSCQPPPSVLARSLS